MAEALGEIQFIKEKSLSMISISDLAKIFGANRAGSVGTDEVSSDSKSNNLSDLAQQKKPWEITIDELKQHFLEELFEFYNEGDSFVNLKALSSILKLIQVHYLTDD